MLNPESVMLNLVQHLFRAGLFQHLLQTLKSQTLNLFQGMVQGDNRQGRGEVRRVRVKMNSAPTRVQHVLPHGGQLKKAVAKHNFHIKYERTNTYELVSGHNCLNPF